MTQIWKIDRSTGYYKRGHVYLHRLIYTQEIGPIPDGYVVHHLDGDSQNNAATNLHAMPLAAHMALHMAEQAHLLPERLSKASLARPARVYRCEVCRHRFTSIGHQPRYCGKRCRDKAYSLRKRAR